MSVTEMPVSVLLAPMCHRDVMLQLLRCVLGDHLPMANGDAEGHYYTFVDAVQFERGESQSNACLDKQDKQRRVVVGFWEPTMHADVDSFVQATLALCRPQQPQHVFLIGVAEATVPIDERTCPLGSVFVPRRVVETLVEVDACGLMNIHANGEIDLPEVVVDAERCYPRGEELLAALLEDVMTQCRAIQHETGTAIFGGVGQRQQPSDVRRFGVAGSIMLNNRRQPPQRGSAFRVNMVTGETLAAFADEPTTLRIAGAKRCIKNVQQVVEDVGALTWFESATATRGCDASLTAWIDVVLSHCDDVNVTPVLPVIRLFDANVDVHLREHATLAKFSHALAAYTCLLLVS